MNDQDDWRIRLYGKEIKEDIDLRQRDRQAWRRKHRRRPARKKMSTFDWLFPLILLSAIFITAAITGDPDEPWFTVCLSCAFE